MVENTDFALTNEPTENENEFVEADPYNRETIARIILWVDWESKEATVETKYNTGGTSIRAWNGLASEFSLPVTVDATEFPEYYKEKVQPVLQRLGAVFESFWDGSNWKGRFNFEDDVLEGQYHIGLDEILMDAPKHDRYIYFDVADSFQNYNEIIDFLAPEIDFLTVDLSNMEIVRAIRSDLEGECIFLESDDEIREDLERMQESLIEDAEEEDE